jgi:serine/threonine-protein kinase 24/25/MST4
LWRCSAPFSIKIATGEELAIKILHLETVRDELDNIQKEISLLSRLDSPYVVQYLGSFLHGTDLNVVMEYMSGGSLRDLMKAGTLQEAEVAAVLKEVLSGLVFLHAAKVVHRDIKAANILINAAGKVKIADFGVAKELNEHKRRFSVVGSPYWMAPEVITAKEGGLYNEKADIWSLGITAIELAKGNPPRSTEKPMKVLVSIPTSPPPKLEGTGFSANFKDFVHACVKFDPIDRPSAKELLLHPFIAGSKDGPSLLIPLLDRYRRYLAKHPPIVSAAPSSLGPIKEGVATTTSSTGTSSTQSSAVGIAGSSNSSTTGFHKGHPQEAGSQGPVSAAAAGLAKRAHHPFKKTSIEKFKLSNPPLEASSDSIDDWDLSSTTRGSPTNSSAPNSPRRLETPPGSGPRRPVASAIKRPLEFSTLSASTDENQFGSVIVHQTADSESSSYAPSSAGAEPPLKGIDEGAGEEDDYSSSMQEQQFGSIVIKSVKKKDQVPPEPATHGTHSGTSGTSGPSGTSGTVDKKTKVETSKDLKDLKDKESLTLGKKSNGSHAATVGARPKSTSVDDVIPSTTDTKLKRDKSKPKIETSGTATGPVTSSLAPEPADSITSTVRRPKSTDRSSHATTSPNLKADKKKEKDSSRPKKKKITTAIPSSSLNHGSTEASNTDSATILNKVVLPVLSKRPSDKVSSIVSSLQALEAESPGFAADFVIGLLRQFEHEQKTLPSIGVHVVLNSAREEYSDLTKYLLSRWRSKTDLPTITRGSDDSYFL